MELKQELSLVSLLKLTSFLFWSVLYIWCALEHSDRSPEWCSRLVTLLHGSVAAGAALAQCGVTDLSPCVLTTKLTWRQYALMLWSCGYFAFDLLWCILYSNKSYIMLCHHGSALVAINVYINKDYTGRTYACTVALMEITNPLLQIRWFLRDGGYNNTIIYYSVEITYLILFLTLRGFLGTYVLYKIIISNIFDYQEKIISLILYLVSLAFIYEIIGYVMHKYRNDMETFKGFANEMGNA